MPAHLASLSGGAGRLVQALRAALDSKDFLVNGGALGFACQVPHGRGRQRRGKAAGASAGMCQVMPSGAWHALLVRPCLQHAYPKSLLADVKAKVSRMTAWG